jgi:branched-chain amino acid aminotransferase
MELMTTPDISIRKTKHSRIGEVDWNNMVFGQHTADHMLVCDYANGAWQTPEILPFGDFSLSPTALCLHYGQTIFEGMKAFRLEDGRINIFRPERHYDRLVRSAERLCMPVISRELFIEGLTRLIDLDRDWVPATEGGALYIRPFMIATEARLGVKVSDTYRFAIVSGPSGPLYSQPLRVRIEREFVRAAKGGTGYAKCGGNYGAAFYPAQKAREQGYDQVLWTDGRENNFIEESGTMNALFVINGKLVTPPLSDSILDGVTRDSLLTLAARAGITVEQRPVSVKELQEACKKGTLTEAFGAGTAAVVSPIRVIGIDGVDYELPVGINDLTGTNGTQPQDNGRPGGPGMALSLRTILDRIRYGKEPDPFGWNHIV